MEGTGALQQEITLSHGRQKLQNATSQKKIYPGATLLPLWARAGGGVKGVGVYICVCVYIKIISLEGIAAVPIKKSAKYLILESFAK